MSNVATVGRVIKHCTRVVCRGCSAVFATKTERAK